MKTSCTAAAAAPGHTRPCRVTSAGLRQVPAALGICSKQPPTRQAAATTTAHASNDLGNAGQAQARSTRTESQLQRGPTFSSRRPPIVAAATILTTRPSTTVATTQQAVAPPPPAPATRTAARASATTLRPSQPAAAPHTPLVLLDDAVRAFRCQIIAQSTSHNTNASSGGGSSVTRTADARTGSRKQSQGSSGGAGGGHMAGGNGGKGGRSIYGNGSAGGSMDEQDDDYLDEDEEEEAAAMGSSSAMVGPAGDSGSANDEDGCSWPADLPATLPPLLGAAPPSFSERPEAVIGKGGCATVYAWSATPSPPSSPAASATGSSSSSRWLAQAVPASAAAVAAFTGGCSLAVPGTAPAPVCNSPSTAASASSAAQLVTPAPSAAAAVHAPAAVSPAASSVDLASSWRWSDVPGEWAVKCDPVSYRHAGNLGECDLDRLGDLLPALLPAHPNVLAPQAWWVSDLQSLNNATTTSTSTPAAAAAAGATPPAARGAAAAEHTAGSSTAVPAPQQPQGGFKLFTLYRRFECSLWELIDRLNTLGRQAEASAAAAAAAAGAVEGGAASSQVAEGSPTEATAVPSVWRARPRMGMRSLLRVVRDVAAALEHLHAHRVLHADLKPENLLLVLDPQHAQHGALEQGRHPAVAQAVLIDFGLARLLPPGVDQLDSKGGTWMYKAPEQMTGPPGMMLAGQERTAVAQVRLESDLWSLGALICYLARDGELRTRPGLPFGQPDDQVAKWGDRPNGRGSQEAFYMLWDDILPPSPTTSTSTSTSASKAPSPTKTSSDGASAAAAAAAGSARVPCAACEQRWAAEAAAAQEEEERASVMALLRRLAVGLMRVDPTQRTPAAQVRVAAAQALLELEQRSRSNTAPAVATAAAAPSSPRRP